MKTNNFFYTAILILFFILVNCSKKSDDKVFVVGIINLSQTLDPFLNGFKIGLKQNGFQEGVNLKYLYNGPSINNEAIRQNVQELIDAEVDLIFTMTGPAALIAKEMVATKNIPIVFTPVYDPVAIGLVNEMQNHQENLTGVIVSGYIPRSLDWLLTICPTVKNIFVPYNPNNAISRECLKTLTEEASKKNITLILGEVKSPKDIVHSIPPDNADAIFVFSDILVVSNIKHYITQSLQKNIPLITTSYSQAQLGAFLAYGTEWLEIGKQTARLAALILNGANPADLPIETPTFYFSINLKTANELGIEVEDRLLRQADHIIRN